MDIKEKIAVVTGANGAIGSALVKKLIECGVKCISIDLEHEYSCDFSNPQDVIKLAETLKAKFPNIDYLYNIAGIGIYKNIEDLSVEEWETAFAINVTAPFIFSKYLSSNMRSSENPMIFNIGSGMGVISAADRSSYCSSKFALRGLSLSLHKELKPKNIDVCLFTLGSIMTPFGTGGIDKRKELERLGKKYLTVEEVTEKIIAITKSTNREEEYTMYPEGYM